MPLVLWAVAAYHGSFSGPFVFDDTRAILANPSIRQLWPPGAMLAPPERMTTSGRPVVNASLALNYAAGGFRVWGYHAINLAIHLLAGLTLAGLVRRTAARGGLRTLTPEQAGFVAALLWLVHPLQTESVTYLVQRAESLAALFYLLTLYWFVRGSGGSPLSAPKAASRRFYWLSGICCLIGMATKEVMATAPIVVLLYDRTFIAGTFTAALRQRRAYYAGLAATWGLLAYLILANHGRGGSIALTEGVSWGRYALTQGAAILHYLRLTLWPYPLAFDYGTAVMAASAALPAAAATLILLGAALLALRRWPVAGFLGCAFFAILAPSSLVPIITETVAEHRMYLPLAAVLVGFVLILDRFARLPARATLALCFALAGAFSIATARRNDDYRDPIRLWRTAAEAVPGNPRAQANLAEALGDAGRYREAADRSREALRLAPDDGRIWFNLGQYEAALGAAAPSIAAYETSLRIEPANAEAHVNLGVALEQSGRHREALDHFRAAVRLSPRDGRVLDDLGITLARGGELSEAGQCFEGALRLDPGDANAQRWLARVRPLLPGVPVDPR